MKISINIGCFSRNINIIDNGERIFDFPNNIKKTIISKMVDKINEKDDLDQIIEELSYHLKPSLSKYDHCEQCGDSNSYEEYEI